MSNKSPKLLIISHNILEETNNVGKTLLSFLTCWPKECLYSIYFRNEDPVNYNCCSYYKLDDMSVLRECIDRKKQSGEIIDGNAITKGKTVSEIENISYQFGNKRVPLVSFLRDRLWIHGNWRNQQFRNWLLSVNPDAIFFIPNDYELAFHVLKFVKEVVDVPVVTFYTDDAFYFNQKCFGIDAVRRRNLRKLGDYVAKVSGCTFTTCPKMSKEYSSFYDSCYYEIGNSVDIINYERKTKPYNSKEEFIVSYIGNLHSNRWKNILDIGEAISILKLQGVNINLHVYSASVLSDGIMRKIAACDGIIWEGKIGPEQVYKEQNRANVLVHTEAFDNKSKKSTRLSVSTKIFEYLFSGNLILGYGPLDVASMEYLNEIGVSVLCDKKEKLYDCLLEIINNYNKLSNTATKGAEYARQHFDKNTNSKKFYEIVSSVSLKERII